MRSQVIETPAPNKKDEIVNLAPIKNYVPSLGCRHIVETGNPHYKPNKSSSVFALSLIYRLLPCKLAYPCRARGRVKRFPLRLGRGCDLAVFLLYLFNFSIPGMQTYP